MSKRAAAIAAVCGLFVSVAWATNGNKVKIKDLVPFADGVTENPDGDGSAHVTFDPDTFTTEFRVTITHFKPHTWYGVAILNGAGGLANLAGGETIVDTPFPGTNQGIFTNPAGNGSWRFENVDQNNLADLTVVIFEYDGDEDNFQIVTANEVRAVGGVGAP